MIWEYMVMIIWTVIGQKKTDLFFYKKDNKLADFVMVNDYPEMETKYTMSEFFILNKYRRIGIGKYAVKYIQNKNKEKWQLKYNPKNKTSENFWKK